MQLYSITMEFEKKHFEFLVNVSYINTHKAFTPTEGLQRYAVAMSRQYFFEARRGIHVNVFHAQPAVINPEGEVTSIASSTLLMRFNIYKNGEVEHYDT